jgi:hypothetical protein
MNNFVESLRVKKFLELSRTFCLSDLVWELPMSGEKEPEYTFRVLYPQFQKFISQLREPGVRLYSDGLSAKPIPAKFSDSDFRPDLALDVAGERTLAVEVKFISRISITGSVSKAIGQGAVYSAFGYTHTHVILISDTGRQILDSQELDLLNRRLAEVSVFAQELGKKAASLPSPA